MLIHVFKITTFYLNSTLIESFNAISPEDSSMRPYYLIFGKGDIKGKEKHENLFAKINTSDFSFIEDLYSLYVFARRNRKVAFLLHGTTYACMSILELAGANVNWICWGAGASINHKNLKSVLFTPIKKIIYNRLFTIKTLINDDKLTLERDYSLKQVELLPYYGHNSLIHKNYFIEKYHNPSSKNKKPIVLLGNNAHNLVYYYELLNLLIPFRGEIIIHCMMQYPKVDEQTLLKLQNTGDSLFGNDSFFVDTQMLDMDSYLEYLSDFDIYLCGNPNQSGLGAVFNCLRLGKKVFLTGKNLNWVRKIGFIVFDIDDVKKASNNDFLVELSEEQKKINLMNNYDNIEKTKKKWIEYLQYISCQETSSCKVR